MIFKGKAKDGKMFLKYPNEFREYLLEREGKDIVIVIDKYEDSKRTKYQNNYYWAIIRQIAKRFIELGYDTNETKTHEYFATTLLSERREVPQSYVMVGLKTDEMNNIFTTEKFIVRSTSSLSKKEFAEYLDTIIRYCAEVLDLEIPTSEEWFT